MKRTTAIEMIAAIFILLFTYTALNKLIDFHKFNIVLAKSPLISDNAKLIAWAIPLIELCTAFVLFIPKARIFGLYISSFLMMIFTVYVGYMLTSDSSLPCSCGGVIQALTWRQHFVLNIFLTALSFVGVGISSKHNKIKFGSEKNRSSSYLKNVHI